ncbi:hypothetical protein CEUSTIGMA_g5146.t1 [Chlamydomonas eustigma]|uniref:D-isomer specific 2-hydroxyacid dehydrogenase NAD-binding domain-containing protein n=1 Tax=Chlamydomonas eustigma TaxID=1157962 RepID=A0A250X3P6_9CHLO|nr:hypothetical protein CEUSTIGMA_g5146.t1 [Chlamydomonas eustigma]|eukprot:GAX77703.1 hypothetical protein CEUSTIGMA_g5146.t1 [Chlamydomonas eustigma]
MSQISPDKPVKLIVVAGKNSPELSVLSKLPQSIEVVGIGKPEDFAHLTPDECSSISVLLNCGVGENAGKKHDVQALWGKLPNLKWMHSASAGLEHLLFQEMVDSDIVLTNAKIYCPSGSNQGVYSNSLAEFSLLACKWFAMDVPRLLKAKRDRQWAPFEVEELRGKIMGVIGFGDIGKACGRLGKAYQMKVLGLRRKTEISSSEAAIVDKMYRPDQICELMSMCDYVVVSTPYTPDTHHLVSAEAIAAMKPNAVLVNVGRGKCINEAALIEALSSKKIRGAALDVFETEPLPTDSPLWELENALITPHCADRTKEFQVESIEFFVSNAERFVNGEELMNVCDKRSGY